MQEQDFKAICGQLIGRYRIKYYEKTKSYQYTQRGMITKAGISHIPEARKSLCSTTTLRQLEKGEVKKNDDLYRFLGHKINRSYLYSRRHIETIEQLTNKVYDTVGKMNLTEMAELLSLIKNHSLNSYLYYAENLQILSCLLSFYLHQHLPDEAMILWYQQIRSLMPEVIQRMIIHLNAEYYRRIDYRPEKLGELANDSLLIKKDYLCLYTLIPYHITLHQYLKASILLDKLKSSCDFLSNPYKQFYYYNMSACILTNIDFEAADEALRCCAGLIGNRNHFSAHQKAVYYHNIGLRHLFKQHYPSAAEYMALASQLNPRIIPAMLPYLYQACQNIPDGNRFMRQTLARYRKAGLKPTGLFHHYCQYFARRCNPLDRQTAMDLEIRIIKHIFPALRVSSQKDYYSSYLRELFLNELKMLHRISHSQNTIEKI